MYRINREKLKTYILVVLVVTSIIQVGILWDYQSHGFPTNFLTVFFNTINAVSADSPEKAREEFFSPYRIIASNGSQSHWLIDRDDEFFSQLWYEAESYLSRSLDTKPVLTLPYEDWGDLVTRKVFVFEFKNNINMDLIKWFLDKSKIESALVTGVHKIIIAPWDDVDENIITIYILDSKGIYKYAMRFNSSEADGEFYDKLLSDLESSRKYKQRQYWVIKEFDPSMKKLGSLDPDILCAVPDSPRYRGYNKLSWSVPSGISDLKYMAEAVLGNEMVSFDRSIDIYDTVVFKTTDNIYRIYKDGLLEYKYIPGVQDGDRGNAGSAFLNAFRFINRIKKNLVSGADIYLSGVEKRGGSVYRFTFDYMVDDVPVVMNYGPRGKDSMPVTNAIVITANGRRVLKCRWMLKHFKLENETGDYDVYLDTLSSSVNLSRLAADDITVSYVVESDKGRNMDPSWVVEKHGGEILVVPLQSKEGD